jgi:hypothetical protein
MSDDTEEIAMPLHHLVLSRLAAAMLGDQEALEDTYRSFATGVLQGTRRQTLIPREAFQIFLITTQLNPPAWVRVIDFCALGLIMMLFASVSSDKDDWDLAAKMMETDDAFEKDRFKEHFERGLMLAEDVLPPHSIQVPDAMFRAFDQLLEARKSYPSAHAMLQGLVLLSVLDEQGRLKKRDE